MLFTIWVEISRPRAWNSLPFLHTFAIWVEILFHTPFIRIQYEVSLIAMPVFI